MILVGDRKPGVLVGGRRDPYMRRWWLLPRNRWLNVYLHEFLRSDDDRALHDHPWWSVSFLLQGRYVEHLPGGRRVERAAPAVILRSAEHAHRIEVVRDQSEEAVTLFITGPKVREWGFLCPRGSRHHEEFAQGLNPDNGASLDGASLDGASAGIPKSPEELAARLAERVRKYRARNPDVPVIENIDAVIYDVIKDAPTEKLKMNTRHTCETTHCRAGWAITLAGESGKSLEAKYGSAIAGGMIYRASTGRRPNFYASDEKALADIKKCAGVV